VKKKEDISDSEKKLWEEYLKNPRDILDKELENKQTLNLPKRYHFDLHGFTLLEANLKIRELIFFCEKNSYKEILLITGKGLHSNTDKNTYVSKELSKLKFSVPEYLKSQKELAEKIIEIKQAEVKDGGEGAIIIKLKKL
jgi:DNA-nicking Smr family endonuclease